MNQIKFILNDKTVEIDFKKDNLSPTTTVLNYLRNRPNTKGTKEGCAEGDCGACSVVLEQYGSKKNEFKAVDSCLMFLPMLHGKRIITVEGVGSSTDLHPVQQAMVDTDGSQCGYCTPGFITSMYALNKNVPNASREDIDDALTGNLCRCTGYRPIVEAAQLVSELKEKKEPNFRKDIEELYNQNDSFLEIKTTEQTYFKPFNLKDALALRKKYPKAIIVNGGTDIGLLVTKRNELLKQIIDISDVYEINDIRSNQNVINYGAGVPLEKVKEHCKESLPALYEMLKVFGSKQIRSLGTLGGNVANASPIGDTPPVLLSYKTSVVLERENGQREMLLKDFIKGYRTTDLKPDELITRILIPIPSKSMITKAYKISKRKDLDISTVSAGFSIELDKNKVKSIDLFYGGMAAMTKRASKAEKFLKGKEWNRKNVESAMKLIDEEFIPISDARAEKEGRAVMARNLLLKFWSETC